MSREMKKSIEQAPRARFGDDERKKIKRPMVPRQTVSSLATIDLESILTGMYNPIPNKHRQFLQCIKEKYSNTIPDIIKLAENGVFQLPFGITPKMIESYTGTHTLSASDIEQLYTVYGISLNKKQVNSKSITEKSAFLDMCVTYQKMSISNKTLMPEVEISSQRVAEKSGMFQIMCNIYKKMSTK